MKLAAAKKPDLELRKYGTGVQVGLLLLYDILVLETILIKYWH